MQGRRSGFSSAHDPKQTSALVVTIGKVGGKRPFLIC
jgi:hypothetical protein